MPGPNQLIELGQTSRDAVVGNGFFEPKPSVSRGEVVTTNAHDVAAAGAAMDAKAAETGAHLGDATLGGPAGVDELVGDGSWRRVYPSADIYYSPATGAHEVHGNIRWKYDELGGPASVLGLPVADESPTPDGQGAFSPFQGGSIYWSTRTGPMMVTGRVLDVWAAHGWEAGGLGYPVMDQHRMKGLTPDDRPDISWCVFENGVVVATKDGQMVAEPVPIVPEDVRRVVRRYVDVEFHERSADVGLHPPIETTSIGPWRFDPWAAKPRTITFRLHGFHKNGAWADTDFAIDLGLSFALRWTQSSTEPGFKTLVATLESLDVNGENNSPLGGGVVAGAVTGAVRDGIRGAFARGGPDPDHPEVPDGSMYIAQIPTGVRQTTDSNIDLIDVLVAADGALMVYVNPLPTAPIDWGHLRRLEATTAVNNLVEGSP